MALKAKKRITAPIIRKRKGGKKIVMLTAYDFTMAALLDGAVDCMLVGDSLGCVVQGGDTTLPVTLDEMIYHAKMVTRGAKSALVIGDLPFGTYQVGTEDAMRAAIRLVKEAGVGAVKLEGGVRVQETIKQLVLAGIPVMGHIGLTPQSFHAFGGHKVQGKSASAAESLLADARA
ncbi:MAG: 3-methyl-2-oxobutanoate hydroxymethyltransferase, partial [Planctomycetota bacterium]|nr:3-methyl-2-oxobutanoate hydroxymethyltransferase [Planctomycetota bacterium]